MADQKNEPSAQTKALLERTRAAKAKQGETKPMATVIEDAKPVTASAPAKVQTASQPDPADPFAFPPDAKIVDKTVPEAPVQPTVTEQPRIQNNETDNQPAASNDELKVHTRTMSRTEAERERGRQIVARNEEARERAQANRRREEKRAREQNDD